MDRTIRVTVHCSFDCSNERRNLVASNSLSDSLENTIGSIKSKVNPVQTFSMSGFRSFFKVRLASLNVIQELSRKLAMNYQTLLAEAIPFLAELMEGKRTPSTVCDPYESLSVWFRFERWCRESMSPRDCWYGIDLRWILTRLFQ